MNRRRHPLFIGALLFAWLALVLVAAGYAVMRLGL